MTAASCNDCGAGVSRDFMASEITRAMDEHGVCWTCGYWRVQAASKNETVIDGRIYSVGDIHKKSGPHNGMAGRRFDIEYFDGRRVTTHDLWAGSEIPERYKAQIPDTARFLGGAGFVCIGDDGAWNASQPEAST